ASAEERDAREDLEEDVQARDGLLPEPRVALRERDLVDEAQPVVGPREERLEQLATLLGVDPLVAAEPEEALDPRRGEPLEREEQAIADVVERERGEVLRPGPRAFTRGRVPAQLAQREREVVGDPEELGRVRRLIALVAAAAGPRLDELDEAVDR